MARVSLQHISRLHERIHGRLLRCLRVEAASRQNPLLSRKRRRGDPQLKFDTGHL